MLEMKGDDFSVHSLSLDSLSLTEHEHPHEVVLEDEADTDARGKTGDLNEHVLLQLWSVQACVTFRTELKCSTKQDADL